MLIKYVDISRDRASKATSPEEMAMHRCLADRVFKHFSENKEIVSSGKSLVHAACEVTR